MSKYAISIVIPTYQRRSCVETLLLSLTRQTFPVDAFEVIVSIDGSEDGTQEMVEQFSAPFHLVALWQANQGRAAACNAGIRAAQGEVLVLLDDDMEPVAEFLAAHWREHQAGTHLGVLGAVPLKVNETVTPAAAYVAHKFNQHLMALAKPGHQFGLRDFYSGNFSIRRNLLCEVGLFDEAFRIYGNEDLELSLRLFQAGARLMFSAQALAWQHYTKDFAGLARDNIAKGRTAVLLALKHPEALPDLKLAGYRIASRKWRLLRSTLLRLSERWPANVGLILGYLNWLDRRHVRGPHVLYTFTLDYCYWLGARAALRENRRGSIGLSSLVARKEGSKT